MYQISVSIRVYLFMDGSVFLKIAAVNQLYSQTLINLIGKGLYYYFRV